MIIMLSHREDYIFVLQVRDADNVEDMRSVAMDYLDLLFECGFNRPAVKLELTDKVNIIQTVALQKVILTSLAELNDF